MEVRGSSCPRTYYSCSIMRGTSYIDGCVMRCLMMPQESRSKQSVVDVQTDVVKSFDVWSYIWYPVHIGTGVQAASVRHVLHERVSGSIAVVPLSILAWIASCSDGNAKSYFRYFFKRCKEEFNSIPLATDTWLPLLVGNVAYRWPKPRVSQDYPTCVSLRL